jgi:nucleoporin NDC1
VSQLHVGQRTSLSGLDTFKQYAPRLQSLQTAAWYLFSAWLFGETFIYSASREANIYWVTGAKSNERPRLNERPIYLIIYFLALALVQTTIHLYYDYDRVDLPLVKVAARPTSSQRIESVSNPLGELRSALPRLCKSSMQRAFVMTIAVPFIYSLSFVRNNAWSWWMMVARLFWSLPKSSALPAVTPFHWRLLLRSFTAGFMLFMLWEFGNMAFSSYVAQDPLKNDRPITYESRDPNGSLITGLKGKKLQTKVCWVDTLNMADQLAGIRVLGTPLCC